MSLFSSSSSSSPKPPFVFNAPGVAPHTFNPFLAKVMRFDRPMKSFQIAYSKVAYPTPVVRVDWAQCGPYEGRAYCVQFDARQAEVGDDIADWLITAGWALGAQWIAHIELPPGQIHFRTRENAYSPLISAVDRIVRPNVPERYTIPFDTKDFYHQAAEHGVTLWSFDVTGPRWGTLTPARRRELLERDPTLALRKDGFRTLPAPSEIFSRIKGVQRSMVSFSEAVSFKGERFVPRSQVVMDDDLSMGF